MISLYNGDCREILKQIKSESVNCAITSPPYFNLRNYNHKNQIGIENDSDLYINALIEVFNEVYRVLKKNGSCFVNIDDVYKDKCLLGIPDKFKLKMIENGWICRNEIIWHKPNAMPSSAKTRFNNDYEKLFFFVKDKNYYFETQYEPLQSNITKKAQSQRKNTKYKNDEQEASVRQGMNKSRGNKLVFLRKNLPEQKRFIDFLRSKTTIDKIVENSNLKRSKVEHWFRYDDKGFSFPSVDDWNEIKHLVDDWSEEFNEIDQKLNDVTIETDDILKNVHKGRIKRCVWSINTQKSNIEHFAMFPEQLVEIPIKATTKENDVVLDMFMGSGTTGIVAKKLNRDFIGIELNTDYYNIAKQRIK